MKYLAVLAAVVGVVYCANTMCWTVDQISDQVILEMDVNQDGILEQDEITTEMLDKWNLNNDSCLNFHEFTSNWVATYHDHHSTAHAFFNNLDLDGDGELCLIDVAVQLVTFDQNPVDGQIQPVEFNAFMHAALPGFLPVLTSAHCKRLTASPHGTAVGDVDVM